MHKETLHDKPTTKCTSSSGCFDGMIHNINDPASEPVYIGEWAKLKGREILTTGSDNSEREWRRQMYKGLYDNGIRWKTTIGQLKMLAF